MTLLTLAALSSGTWALATSYVYDANGRLVVVTNDAGESARYVYDNLGNITQIQRLTASDLAIFSFSPGRGAPGIAVKVRGQGFSATPSSNALTFNGVAATVSAATATELTTTVPATATTGPIAVTVGANTATSPINFIVDANAKPPIITSVTPLKGVIGTAITVNGQGLNPIANQTSVRLSQHSVVPTSLINTKAIFPIPTGTGSGKVTVSTPFGTAFSTQDVLVVPEGIPPADITMTKRGTVDGAAQTFSVTAVGKYAAELFDADAGSMLTLQFTAMAAGDVTYTLYGPTNKYVVSGTASSSAPSVHLPRLRAAGTYMLLMYPTAASATWKVAIEKNKVPAIGGAALATATTVANQQKRLTFTASAGQSMGLGFYDVVLPGGGTTLSMTVYDPNGAGVVSTTCYVGSSGCALNVQDAIAGVYSLVISPPYDGNQTMSFKTMLSLDIASILQQDVMTSLSLPRRGQNGQLTFAGTAGQTVALQVAGQTTVPANSYVYYNVYQPDGTYLTGVAVTANGTLNLPNLPTTGNYTVFVDPANSETVTTQMMLASGTTGGMVLNGASGTFTTTTPGQNAYLTFTATAGQNLGLGIFDVVLPGNGSYLYATIYDPNGIGVATTGCYAGYPGCALNVENAIAGTYSVVVTPPYDGNQTMGFKTTLSSDVTGTLSPNTSAPLNIGRRGQNGRLTFAGVAGQTLAVQVAGQVTEPSNGSVYYNVYQPDGTYLTGISTASNGTINFSNLPATGNYTVFVDAAYGETVTVQLTLATGTTSGMVLNGANGAIATTVPGQGAFLVFSADAGQNLGLGIHDVVMPGGGAYITATVYNPNGAIVTSTGCYAGTPGCALNIDNTIAGLYSVVIGPPYDGDQTMSFKATLSSDVTGTLLQDASANLNLARYGQNARLTFTGTVGQTMALQIAGQTTVPANGSAYYNIYRPDGSYLAGASITSNGTLNLPSLPATGNYTVIVDPPYGETLAAQVMLATGTVGGMVLNGASGAFATTTPGQNIFLTFNATAGQKLGLGISDVVMPGGGSYLYASLYDPSGAAAAGAGCYAGTPGCALNVASALAGTYSLVITPPYDGDQTMSFNTTLSTDVVSTLSLNVLKNLSLSRRGQNGRLTFSGTAGQTWALRITNQITTPSNGAVNYEVFNPDGTYFIGVSTNSDWVLDLPNLPATGTYVLYVEPTYGEQLTTKLTLDTTP